MAALATVLAGCPASTGRTRGPVDAGPDVATGACPATEPSSGAYCGGTSLRCRYTHDRGCAAGAIRYLDCTCASSTEQWSCVDSPCTTPRRDAGDACPISRTVATGEACSLELAGITCNGVATDCDGGSIGVPCYCGGSTWSCQVPFCPDEDAGEPDTGLADVFDPDAPNPISCPTTSEPGLSCMEEGLRCSYPSFPGCSIVCACVRSAFACSMRCVDAGAPVDASTSD